MYKDNYNLMNQSKDEQDRQHHMPDLYFLSIRKFYYSIWRICAFITLQKWCEIFQNVSKLFSREESCSLKGRGKNTVLIYAIAVVDFYLLYDFDLK